MPLNSAVSPKLQDLPVSIFDKSAREFYDFDRHLPEGSLVDIEDCVRAVDDKMKVTED